MAEPESAMPPLPQRLRAAAGDGAKILELVREAEKCHRDDLPSLSEVYGVAIDVYGHVQSAQDYAFRDLCVKRMRTLCRLSPAEAREFHNRLRTYSVGRADARMYEARASMEERMGDRSKAVKMLREGLRVGAQPAEVLQRVLKRLEPESQDASQASEVPAVLRRDTAPPQEPVAYPGPGRLPPPLPPSAALRSESSGEGEGSGSRCAAPPATAVSSTIGTAASRPRADPAAIAASLSAAARSAPPAAARPRYQAASSSSASSSSSGRQPRILGLGTPMRRLPEEEADDADQEEEEEEEDEESSSARRSSIAFAVAEGYTSTAMSLAPLSPIKEVESPARPPSYVGPHGPLHNEGARAALAAAVAAAKPAAPTSPQPCSLEAPNKPMDVSIDSAVSVSAETGRASASGGTGPAKSSKVVHVNGVPYTQVQTLGRGGSSKVYLVQNASGELFALKRVATENAKQLEAFQNEVVLLQQLRGCEYVIQVEDAEVDREKGRINIVMEAGDMDLGRFLQSEPKLNLAQMQHLWRQMLEAVQVIHQERIVHSDLKPGNFLLVNGRLKVIDFGIAKKISNDTTNISRDASVGTLSYMAPEAVKQGQLKLGRASDIWSLGIILYQMAYGHPPFAHLEPMQRLLRLNDPALCIQFPPDHRLAGHSSLTQAHLTDVLSRCLHRDPRRRPSLPELLSHPFLSDAAEVRRDTVQNTVRALMRGVMQAVSSALPESDIAEHNWQVLADEVWHQLCAPARGKSLTDVTDSRCGSEGQAAQAFDTDSIAGLAPLREALQALKSQKSASTQHADRHLALSTQLGKENAAPRRPLAEVNLKMVATGPSPQVLHQGR
eukprot:TRINITY_DN14324_c0_g2_i1.p1 TRINITY_DN14324_c0_g2~~TRINITY_DN14324_c0_g2_i1.p1  ORF type:complete len:839 (-),score=158.42 TRINITY_DN14324_c0_g2_i1:106-2622(-)